MRSVLLAELVLVQTIPVDAVEADGVAECLPHGDVLGRDPGVLRAEEGDLRSLGFKLPCYIIPCHRKIDTLRNQRDQ